MALPETPPNEMTFWEHLQELRVRILRALLILAGGFALTYAFRFRLWELAQRPFLEVFRTQLRALQQPVPDPLQPFAFTGLAEPFFSLMRLSFWAAIFLTAPLLFHQIWSFIRPGLYEREQRMAIPFVLATTVCFLAGAAFAYFFAFRILAGVLLETAIQAGLRSNLRVDDYLSLFLYTVAGTGLVFELPVLVFFLARFRLVTARGMLRYGRHAAVLIVLLAAFLTPGDVIVTTLFFSVILLALYAVSVGVAWIAAPRGERKAED